MPTLKDPFDTAENRTTATYTDMHEIHTSITHQLPSVYPD